MPNTTAIDAAVACAKQAGLCFVKCVDENRPSCAKICHDTSDLCWALAAYLSRDAHGTDALADATADLCLACATECEQHDADHCRKTAVAARAAAAAFGRQAETTPRTPSGERL
ncbi:MAG TPA: hypothetical protein VF595_03375 [Tepidisphaeraceae bacterium]|jgi:hypothetical protein